MKRKEHGSDVCYCGDYRSQHKTDGCGPCRLNPPSIEGCKEFRWGHSANAAEFNHWQKYHGDKAVANRRQTK